MRQRTAEAVELSHTEHRTEIRRLAEDRQHFVSALAGSMNEAKRLIKESSEYKSGSIICISA
jgi:hypothetical protein